LRSNTGDFLKLVVWAEKVMKFALGSRSKQMITCRIQHFKEVVVDIKVFWKYSVK
jgi:hypothetical protein